MVRRVSSKSGRLVRGWSGGFRQKASAPQLGQRGVDRDRVCDRGRAGVANLVAAEVELGHGGVDLEGVGDRDGARVGDAAHCEVEGLQDGPDQKLSKKGDSEHFSQNALTAITTQIQL